MFLKISRNITNADSIVFVNFSIPCGCFYRRVSLADPLPRTIVLLSGRGSDGKKNKWISAELVFPDRFNQVIGVGLKTAPVTNILLRPQAKTFETHKVRFER